MPTIDLGYRARPQFVPYHTRRERFSAIVAHRRAGKTVACIADLVDDALRSTKTEPRLAYIAPTYAQAKDVAWSYLKRFTAPIPGVKTLETELSVTMPNEARIRLYGADNYDRMRGVYIDNCVVDEPADMDPRAWPEVIRPALSDRKGKATFIGTPKGRNWFYDIVQTAKREPDWFGLTLKASETGLLDEDELASARKMLTEDQFAQEYECSFEAAVMGAYYGKLMNDAEAQGRITGVPHEPTALTWTAWDLGMGDATSIWFSQVVGREIHVIDYYENSGVGFDHYAGVVRGKGYNYGGHLVPHDAQARELGTGKTRIEVMETLGLPCHVVPHHLVDDGINAVRMMLPRMWFDATKCARGVDALKLYRADYDEKGKVLRQRPVHDWTSHPADAMRYLAMGLELWAGVGMETEREPAGYGRGSGWMSA